MFFIPFSLVHILVHILVHTAPIRENTDKTQMSLTRHIQLLTYICWNPGTHQRDGKMITQMSGPEKKKKKKCHRFYLFSQIICDLDIWWDTNTLRNNNRKLWKCEYTECVFHL